MKQGRHPSTASEGRLSEILPAASKMALEAACRRLLGPGPGVARTLRKELTEDLDPPGDLVRGQLALALQQGLAVDHRPAVELAVAIEAFHTASSLFEGRSQLGQRRLELGVRLEIPTPLDFGTEPSTGVIVPTDGSPFFPSSAVGGRGYRPGHPAGRGPWCRWWRATI